ncbi:MAG: fibronectin type III domain-containing protein, partial [Candidatus Lokiarchaeota archaeon]|nr:fibronectin type III domain-containing protein [Candidatus Lokiarchaeota archaeon]
SYYSDTGLSPDTTYYYIVRAIDNSTNLSLKSSETYSKTFKINNNTQEFFYILLVIVILSAIALSIGYLYIKEHHINKEANTKEFKSRAKLKKKSLEKIYWKPENIEIFSFREPNTKYISQNKLNQIINKENAKNIISNAKDIRITLLEGDFFDTLEQFKWENEEEKQIFINEMLALSPRERRKIIDEMKQDLEFIHFLDN